MLGVVALLIRLVYHNFNFNFLLFLKIERFELDRGCWMACGKSHGNSFDAKGLISGHEYKFRVSAVNEHGDSDPTEAKETIKIFSSQDMDSSVRTMRKTMRS